MATRPNECGLCNTDHPSSRACPKVHKTIWEERFERILDTWADPSAGIAEVLWTCYRVLDESKAFGSIRVAESARAALERLLKRRTDVRRSGS